MTTYEIIKSLRLISNMSQEELAERTGYKDRSSIAKIEAGKVDLTESKILMFSEIFHVSPSELMGLSSIPELNMLNLSDEESDLILCLRTLNAGGRKKLCEYAHDLSMIDLYREYPAQQSKKTSVFRFLLIVSHNHALVLDYRFRGFAYLSRL